MTKIAMIPARMGSQRLKRKNLAPLAGVELIRRAVRRCKAAECFDEVVVNSEDAAFRAHAEAEGARFHQRPERLGDNNATSEDFITEFLKTNACTRVYQVHSIAPLASANHIREFVQFTEQSGVDTALSCVEEQIECALDGKPINFTFDEKTNSQDLKPVQRIIWSLTAWRSDVFLQAAEEGRCATYAGKVGIYPLDRWAGLVIKTQDDLDMAEAMLNFFGDGPGYGGPA